MLNDDFGFGPNTKEERVFADFCKRNQDIYTETCRITGQKPTASGLAMRMLNESGEKVIGTGDAFSLDSAIAWAHGTAVSNAIDGEHHYRVIITREDVDDGHM